MGALGSRPERNRHHDPAEGRQAARPRAHGQDGRTLHGSSRAGPQEDGAATGRRGRGRTPFGGSRARLAVPGRYGASDDALVKRTGYDWAHWYRILDAWGAKDRPHPEIARFLSLDLGVDGWWSQELTVRYEMAIGRRVPNQRTDGFEATGSKTIKAQPERVYAAVVEDAERARWIDRPMLLIRQPEPCTSSAFATIRFVKEWTCTASRGLARGQGRGTGPPSRSRTSACPIARRPTR